MQPLLAQRLRPLEIVAKGIFPASRILAGLPLVSGLRNPGRVLDPPEVEQRVAIDREAVSRIVVALVRLLAEGTDLRHPPLLEGAAEPLVLRDLVNGIAEAPEIRQHRPGDHARDDPVGLLD